ncbi:MAG: hypothetical protein ACREML_13150 [Vulcanimicrobiaceae bacterium]
MTGALESTILIAFGVMCAGVFTVGFAFLLRAAIAARRMSRRANAMVPRALLSQLHFAQLDAKRTAKTVKELSTLAPRMAIACGSIVHSANAYRALLARLGV